MSHLRIRGKERLKVKLEESKDERTSKTEDELKQLTDDIITLKVTFSFMVCHVKSTSLRLKINSVNCLTRKLH